MNIKTAYPLIVDGKIIANGHYEGGFENIHGKRRVIANARPIRKSNPDESPADVQARNLIDGASAFDGDKMNSYADGKKPFITKEQLLNIGAVSALIGLTYLLFIKTK